MRVARDSDGTSGPVDLPPASDFHTFVFDFDGVFTDNKVYVDQDGREMVRCDRADGLAFDMVRYFQSKRRCSAEFFILSKERNPVVAARARKLRIDCRFGVGDKLSCMQSHFREARPSLSDPFDGLFFAGNDLNDLGLIRRAGYSVAPADAHPMVKLHASWVSARRGGDSFVREVIEGVFRVHELSPDEVCAMIASFS